MKIKCSEKLSQLVTVPRRWIVEDCLYPIGVGGYTGPIYRGSQKLDFLSPEATLFSVDREACLRQFTKYGVKVS
jgi:hypothetical protein